MTRSPVSIHATGLCYIIINIMDNVQQLIELERGFWKAAGDPEGDKYYEDNFDDAGVLILPFDGGVLDKSSVMPMIPKSNPWQRYDFSNIKVLPIDDNSIELYYEVQASHGDDLFHAYVGSIYVSRKDESWKMLMHQQTSL